MKLLETNNYIFLGPLAHGEKFTFWSYDKLNLAMINFDDIPAIEYAY